MQVKGKKTKQITPTHSQYDCSNYLKRIDILVRQTKSNVTHNSDNPPGFILINNRATCYILRACPISSGVHMQQVFFLFFLRLYISDKVSPIISQSFPCQASISQVRVDDTMGSSVCPQICEEGEMESALTT